MELNEEHPPKSLREVRPIEGAPRGDSIRAILNKDFGGCNKSRIGRDPPKENGKIFSDASKPDANSPGQSAGEASREKPAVQIPPARIRLRFEKRGALKFISHHDLMRTFELALRRAQIRVAYTQGFNPRPKLSFAMALPLGVESLDEIVDLDLIAEGAPEPGQILSLLGAQMPPGISLTHAWPAKGRPRVTACEYRVELDLDEAQLASLSARLAQFLAGGQVMHERSKGPKKRARVLDVRAFTESASLDASILSMRLKFTPQGGMKPTDLLEVLGLDALSQRVVKTRTIFEEEL